MTQRAALGTLTIAVAFSLPVLVDAKVKKFNPKVEMPEISAETSLRIWKPVLTHHGELKLVWRPMSNRKPVELQGGAFGDQFMDPAPIPSGPGELSVFDKAETSGKPTVRLEGTVLADGAIAVVTETADGTGLKASWVRIGSERPNRGELIIYNFVDGLKDFKFSMGTAVNIQATGIGTIARLTGLKRIFSPIVITGQNSDGKTFHWNSEIDFTKASRGVVLISLDRYGRIQPEVVIEGDENAPQPAKNG